MGSFPRTQQSRSLGRVRPILSALHLFLAGGLHSRSWAQGDCGVEWTTPIRVENASGVSTLREATSCTNGGSLEADWAGVAVTIDEPISIASGTSLSVTVESALAEVQGGLETRLFEVLPGGGLTLTQLKLSGGAAENGGAIYSDSATLTLDRCTFHGNSATEGDGGAVWADKGSVTIVGVDFLGNTATRYGGAVFATNATLVIEERSRFESNEAAIGGALFCGRGMAEVGLADFSTPSCAIRDTEFTSNIATSERYEALDPYAELDGGGAAAFLRTNVTVAGSNFIGNHALRSGGALYGGNTTDIQIGGCIFGMNTAARNGGTIVASSLTLGGSTRLTGNMASSYGGAVFGWDAEGTITFNDVVCANNSANSYGGCFYASGRAVTSSGTVMQNNVADKGGCIYAYEGSNISIDGGDFMCRCTDQGGFLFAGDGSRVRIIGGLFENNVAVRRAGAVYCEGGASTITIEGGTFRDNRALEVGGAIVAWGASTLVTITGGVFSNNTAKFYGGFTFLEERASFNCQGATIRGNYAEDQGGGIYARESTLVNSSCDLIANESPQGAALYLTNVESATFKKHKVAGNLASGGSVVYVAASSVVARAVAFKSSDSHSSNRAIQTAGDTTLTAEKCMFDGWVGDTVIYHTNSAKGSLVLDSCNFRGSSTTLAVTSPNSKAEIRNAIVGDSMVAKAITGTSNSSLTLVDRALDCSDYNACGAGECVDSALGVLCECLESGECLDGGGGLSLNLATTPQTVTYSSDPVSYTLEVSSAEDGTTYVIWNLKAEAPDLSLSLIPSSGVLPPGGTATVTVMGTSMNRQVQGNLTSSFVVTSADGASSGSTSGDKLVVCSMFFLCHAHEYSMSLFDGDGGDVQCEQCATIDGGEGVACNSPGVMLTSLPIRQGYWRSSRESLKIHECLYLEACAGATEISSSDDYCEAGYKGPYCAVCTRGYGRGVGNSCHYCDNTTAYLLTAVGILFSLAMLLLLLLAAVFLVGGLDAIDIVCHSLDRTINSRSNKSSTSRSLPEASRREETLPDLGARMDSLTTNVVPAFDSTPEHTSSGDNGRTCHDRIFTSKHSETKEAERTYDRHLRVDVEVEACVKRSDRTRIYDSWNAHAFARRDTRKSAAAGESIRGAQTNKELEVEVKVGGGGRSKFYGLGKKVKRWVHRLPLNKLKILVVVWQILAGFANITGAEFPAAYSMFLSWISVVNLDLGSIFSASCVLPSVTFYVRLLITTLGPVVLVGGLVLTYNMAKRLAGIGSAGVIARRAAWSRHLTAGLLLLFLVFTSASTVVFNTFVCDDDIVDGESYLRADYGISCKTSLHSFFKVYAGFMILVYPLGIPALYATILWQKRGLLNPRICLDAKPKSNGNDEAATRAFSMREDTRPTAILNTTFNGQTKRGLSRKNFQELEEKVRAQREHPELVPSRFLWKDFGPEWYYYEVIECGRRILLTGVLIFISPACATQAATACVFAFGSLLGFELMRPHLDPADSWLYRLGCVTIFLSNFLALLIKVDAGEERNRNAFGVLLVAVNVALAVAVLATSWFATRQSADDTREEEGSFIISNPMLKHQRHDANNTRLTHSDRAPMSSASFSVRRQVLPSDPGVV